MRQTNRSPTRRATRGHRLAILILGSALMGLPPLARAQTADSQDGDGSSAPAPTGIVRITSPIPRAQVYIDNEPAGEAPFIRYLTAGPHTVRVAVDGYDPFVRRVDVVAGSTVDLSAQLLPGTGTAEFVVHPGGAQVILDGGDPVPTPVRMRDLAEGTHTYRMEAAGCEPDLGTFTFKRGQNLLFNRTLRLTAGLLVVRTDPPGARVWLDGVTIGASPLELQDVPPGPHVVRLEAPSRATVFRRFDNSDGSKGEIVADLPNVGAQISVSTGLPSASVSLEGTLLGIGEVVRVTALEHGHYTLTVSAPDRQSVDLPLDVGDRGTRVLRAELKPISDGGSRIVEVHPLYARWTFWTAAALGAGAAAGGAVALVTLLTPEPVPASDTVVVLP